MYYYIRIISSMLPSINHQSWLFFLPLAQQASWLKDDWLDPVDDLLDDEERMALVRQCLATLLPPVGPYRPPRHGSRSAAAFVCAQASERLEFSQKRKEREKQRWFRRALRWRAGCESTISTLKHPFSMWRAMYKGDKDPEG